jgi:hypothetical protein
MVPPGSSERSLFGCCFAGLLRGTPMADVKKGMMGAMESTQWRRWRGNGSGDIS